MSLQGSLKSEILIKKTTGKVSVNTCHFLFWYIFLSLFVFELRIFIGLLKIFIFSRIFLKFYLN